MNVTVLAIHAPPSLTVSEEIRADNGPEGSHIPLMLQRVNVEAQRAHSCANRGPVVACLCSCCQVVHVFTMLQFKKRA